MQRDGCGEEKSIATIGAAFLGAASKTLNLWSIAFFGGAVLLIATQPLASWSVVLLVVAAVLGLMQVYWAIRCAFDAKIFQQLGDRAERFIELDRVLELLGLTRSRGLRHSSVEHRVKAAMRLLRWQAVAFGLQSAVVVLILIGRVVTGF